MRSDDPLGFVVSMNLRRRHLSTSQRAIMAAELSGPLGENHGGDRKSDQRAFLPVDRAEAASLLNVSERSVKNAAALIEAAPEIAQRAALAGEREDQSTISRAEGWGWPG